MSSSNEAIKTPPLGKEELVDLAHSLRRPRTLFNFILTSIVTILTLIALFPLFSVLYMLIVRGVNVFPSSVEQILRAFPEIVEYRVTITKQGSLDALSVEIEDRLSDADRVVRELQIRLGLKVDVRCVPLGSLPRFEGKGRRFHDQRLANYQI